MNTKHTPLPWAVSGRTIIAGNGRSVCNNGNSSTGQEAENLDYIVRACNAHDDLVAALAALLNLSDYETITGRQDSDGAEFRTSARTALAKAKGE